jgi:hypothetical protein
VTLPQLIGGLAAALVTLAMLAIIFLARGAR